MIKEKDKDIVCAVNFIDEAKVKYVKGQIPDDKVILHLADTFKNLGDFTRLKILLTLAEAELCVCDLSASIGVSVSAISHQLRLLKNLRLVKYRKEGKMVYYSLDDEHIRSIVGEARKHIEE